MENSWIDWQRQAPTYTDQQVREVYARFGLAAYCGQCVERQIGLMLATMYGNRFFSLKPDDRDSAFEAEFAKTLGKMANDLSERLDLPSAFEGRLRHAVNRRNWLMHAYFWDRSVTFTNVAGREDMIVELQELVDFFSGFDDELKQIHQMWLDSVGISKKRIKEELNRLTFPGGNSKT